MWPPPFETGPAADRGTQHCFVGCGNRCRLFGALSGRHLKHGAARPATSADGFPLYTEARAVPAAEAAERAAGEEGGAKGESANPRLARNCYDETRAG